MFWINFLASGVTFVHLILIVAVFIGIGLSIKYKRFRPIEALVLLTAVVIWSLYGGCPLTNIEAYLRGGKVGEELLSSGFISYYLNHWFQLDIEQNLVDIATYILATVFVLLTIEWEIPFIKKLLKRM